MLRRRRGHLPPKRGARSRPNLGRGGGYCLSTSAQRLADDELQPGPHLVDGAHLHVDPAERQRVGADRVLGDVGGPPGGLLRPRHPQHGVGRQQLAQPHELRAQRDTLGGEHVHERRVGPGPRRQRGALRPRCDERAVVARLAHHGHPQAGSDAELLRERSAGVACGGHGVCILVEPRDCGLYARRGDGSQAHSAETEETSMARKPLYKSLYAQVIVAIIIGVVLGVVDPGVAEAMKPLGDGFIKLIKMIIAPIIFCTVVVGIAGMEDMKKVGKTGGLALLYFEVVSSVALVVGLVIINLVQPGSGMNVDASTLDTKGIAAYTGPGKMTGTTDFLLNVIPSTVVDAFAKGELL